MANDIHLTYGVVRVGETVVGIPIDNLTEVFHSSEYSSLPINSEFLQGGVDLRGKLVPIIDISLIGKFGKSDNSTRLGIVLESSQKLLSFFIDAIVGIANISPNQISEITDSNDRGASFFKSVFPFKEKFVTVLSVEDIFTLPDVLSVNRTDEGVSAASDKGPPMLTFLAGGALYALPAVEVHAAVPKQIIEETAITSGPCLGEITYHDRRIPVICPVTILGLGRKSSRSVSEVVVLRFPDGLLLGVAVDAIRDIRTFPTAKETKIPLWQMDQNFIQKVLVQDDGEQIYVIDVKQLCGTKEIADIASLSEVDVVKPVEKTVAKDTVTANNIVKERERYLVVDLHTRLAIPLLQVTCILDQPKNVTPTKFNTNGFRGYFSRLGDTIALIDLRERLGAGQVTSQQAQVLIAEDSGAQIGFLVDRVVGIEVSQWREKLKGKAGTPETVVQLGGGDTSQVLPFLDLSALEFTKSVQQSPSG
ncbi:MAG: chemotaxis protein CheW [Silicimonas sp.]|nr:chemotaxis protein CheW [Silicimonas sp.]